MSSRSFGLLAGLVLGIAVLGTLYYTARPTPSPVGGPEEPTPALSAIAGNVVSGPPKVKLAVLVVFDQMRGDYIDRWADLYGAGGFRRITSEGTHFKQCYYPFGITATGPGHGSVLTGCSADKHGITNNEWFDRATSSNAYCAGTDRYEIVPAPAGAKKGAKKNAGTPERLKCLTVGDALKESTGGKAKVFGLSLKDRSAILPVGKKPDGAYWFDGRFVTSTYYRETVHPWVADFNRSKVSDQWFETPWQKVRADLDYVRRSGPDEVVGEARQNGRNLTFPHTLTGGQKDLGKEYYESLANSPYGNDLLLAFTKACVVSEKLGEDDIPDLLAVSFSSNDLVGHTYGPDSQEVLDCTLRSDALMADFLAFLDDKVGKGNYCLAVTADHGICPLPELSAALGRDAKRVPAVQLMLGAERHLQSRFGKLDGDFETTEASKRTTWIETISAPWLYVNERLCAAKGVKKEAVAAEYVAWLRQQPDVMNAYTAEELSKPEGLDEVGKLMAKSFAPGRSGDVGVVLKPYYLIDKPGSGGTNHGSPHDYDRHVPLLAFGPGLKSGPSDEAVTPQHSAAILSYFLGIATPKDCEYAIPKTLLK